MPHIRLRHIPEDQIVAASTRLIDRLQEAIGCDRSWITLSLDQAIAIRDGAVVQGQPYAEVHWFPRDAAIKEAVSLILSDTFKGQAEYLTTVFHDLSPHNYYEDGKALG